MKKLFEKESKPQLGQEQREELLAGLVKTMEEGYAYSSGAKLREYAAEETDPQILKTVFTKALNDICAKNKDELGSVFSAIFEYSAHGANIIAAEKFFELLPDMVKGRNLGDALQNFSRIAHWDKELGDFTIKNFDTIFAKIDDPTQQARFASAFIDRGRALGPLPEKADALTLHVVERGLEATAKIKDFEDRVHTIGFIGLRHAQQEDALLQTGRHMMLAELDKANTPEKVATILRASTGYLLPDVEIDAAAEEKWKAAVAGIKDKDAKFKAAIDVAEVTGSYRASRVERGKTLAAAVEAIVEVGAEYLKEGEIPKNVVRALEGIVSEGYDKKGGAGKLLKQVPPPAKPKVSLDAFLSK